MIPRIIALGGVARSGKDTFYQTLNRLMPGAVRISVGDIIRRDCKSFIKKTLGINVDKCTDQEKELIRPILVDYGKIKRKQTKGAYFRELLENIMVSHLTHGTYKPGINYFIMTDLRYAEYEFDEPQWVKLNNGVIIHISRIVNYKYGIEDTLGNMHYYPEPQPVFLQGANPEEWENDPKIKAEADYCVEWKTKNDSANFEFHVNSFLNWFNGKCNSDKNFSDRFK